jgi:hypothetical protein
MDNEKLTTLMQQSEVAKSHLASIEAEMDAICPKMRIATVMSVPLCGWNPHWGCHIAALHPWVSDGAIRAEDQLIAYGAWWDHGVSNAFEDLLERGVHWILTMDYDSMFTMEHVSALFHRLGTNPHIDAIAAMQCRRGSEETPLVACATPTDIHVDGSAFPVDSAHFGLTVIRCDALAKVPKPWFVNEPDPNGSYRTLGRVDSDMFFWRKWKEAGNTLYVEPVMTPSGAIGIGHLQPLVSEFHSVDGALKARHVHFMDWRSRSARVTDERGERVKEVA